MLINVGIIGATGHTGEILIELLLNHPNVKISHLYNSGKSSSCAQVISDIFPKFKNRLDLICKKPDWGQIKKDCDLVFLALPHTISMKFVPKLLNLGKKVIDLSADYRIKNTLVYEKFYQVIHQDKGNLKEAIYGLPELNREKIKTASLVANPGCYPTCAILSLAPLLALNLVDINSIIIDAKSGVSGAGKKLEYEYLFSEVQGTTIEHFVISHKVERIKELIIYNELNITEIARKMNYSSVAYLSNQFKKVTGLSPFHFKQLKDKRRSSIEEIGN